MRIDGRLDALDTRLDIGEETQQPRGIEAFRKALPVHQPETHEFGIGIKKAVRRQEIDAGMIGPAREQRAQHARCRALADSHRSRDADDERHFHIAVAEKLRRYGVQLLRRRDIEIEQARQRQIDLLDLLDRQLFDDAGKLLEIARLQRHRRVGPEPCPLVARERAVRRKRHVRIDADDPRRSRRHAFDLDRPLARHRAGLHDLTLPRAAFSSRPDFAMRFSRTSRTSPSATPRLSSSTSR